MLTELRVSALSGDHLLLDTISTSARSELAAINEQLQEAAADRDAAQERVDRLEKPAKRLEEAVAAQSVSALARQYGYSIMRRQP